MSMVTIHHNTASKFPQQPDNHVKIAGFGLIIPNNNNLKYFRHFHLLERSSLWETKMYFSMASARVPDLTNKGFIKRI